MQKIFDLWLPQCYPRLNHEGFTVLLKEAHRWHLSTQESQYIVLGCGYLYRVRPVDPEKVVRRITRQLNSQHGSIAAAALVDEGRVRKIRSLAKEQGLRIGPQNRRLTERRKPGQLPNPAPRIASLAVAQWVKRCSRLEPSPRACDLYTALTTRSLTPTTLARYEKIAANETVGVWQGTEEKQIPAINHQLTFFGNRYRRFQRDGFPIQAAQKNPGILYPVDFLEPVVRAAGLNLQEKKNSITG